MENVYGTNVTQVTSQPRMDVYHDVPAAYQNESPRNYSWRIWAILPSATNR